MSLRPRQHKFVFLYKYHSSHADARRRVILWNRRETLGKRVSVLTNQSNHAFFQPIRFKPKVVVTRVFPILCVISVGCDWSVWSNAVLIYSPQKTRNGGEWRNILPDDMKGCLGSVMQLNTRGSVSRGKHRMRETPSNRKEIHVLMPCYHRQPRTTSFPGFSLSR